MSKNLIYCFSGSGNCLDIAKNIASVLGDTDIVSLRKEPALKDAREAETVGFVFPCHAGGLPIDVKKHISMLTLSPDAYTYAVVSYSGYTGTGLGEVDRLVGLDYWSGISHHCSCIWLFPHKVMMPMLNAEKAEERSTALAKSVAGDVKNRVRMEGSPRIPVFNRVEASVWPKLAAKKSRELSVNASACTHCGQCAKLCPKGNITLQGGLPAFGTDCIGCLSCLQYCPAKAIDIGKVSYHRERYHNSNITAAELMREVIHID